MISALRPKRSHSSPTAPMRVKTLDAASELGLHLTPGMVELVRGEDFARTRFVKDWAFCPIRRGIGCKGLE